MVEVRGFIQGFVSAIIGIVVGVALVPVINQAITDANLSGTQATVVGLVGLITVVGILMHSVRSLL